MPSLNTVIPVAPTVARSNRPGVIPAVSGGRSSQILTQIIPAGKPLYLTVAGQQFYLVLATGAVKIKPNNGGENTYTQGKGQIVPADNQFASLQITNPNPFSVVISIFVGFGDYIDNTTILFNPQVSNVAYPTFPVANAAGFVLIPDLSGQAIVDQNGNEYLALTRQAIYISNLDTGLTYNLTNTANSATVIAVQPQTNIVVPFNGDFRMGVPAGTLNAIISELYSAVLPGIT